MEGIYRLDRGERVWHSGVAHDAPRYDVIVAGGGTAGALAALVVAERGQRVLVVERLNCLGGMSTAGGIEGYYYGNRGGLYEQIDAEAKAYEPLGYAPSGVSSFNVELKKRVLENRLRAAGATLEFEADLTGVMMQYDRVVGVEYAKDDGLHVARASVVIDATAEAYVCLLAGAEYTLGRSMDGKVQPYGNVRVDYYADRNHLGHSYTDCGYVDPTDPAQYSQAVLSAACFPFYLKEDYRVGARLVSMTQFVGMREGPLVEGDVRLRLEDVVDGRAPSDRTLYIAYSNADNHGKDMAFENRPQQDWMIGCSLWGLNFTVRVPVDAVIPKGLDGLLMAGRMVSVDHDLASCVRMERDVQKCGEAVGLLAAEAARLGVPVRDVPYEQLARELRRSGCLLEQNDFGFIDSRRTMDRGRVAFPETLDEIRAGLASEEPGMAQWRVRQLRDLGPVREMLSAAGEHLPIHAAMALALAGDGAGAELLMDAVRRRDAFIPKTSRKYNMIRGAAALYLLGRLAWLPALDTVLDVVRNWQSIVPDTFVPDEFLADAEEYRFQYLSQAITAALEIAGRWPDVREKVDAAIHGVIDAPDFSIHSTLKGATQLKYQMAPMIRNAVKYMEGRSA